MEISRTFLFAPGNHARRVEKSVTLGADAVILDLEDAVANAEKTAARAVVVEALARPRRCRGFVRINPLETQWCYGDLTTVLHDRFYVLKDSRLVDIWPLRGRGRVA